MSQPEDRARRDPASLTPSNHTDGETTLLRFLVDSAADLNSSLRPDKVFAKVAARVRTLVDCHLFSVLLWNQGQQQLEPSFSLCLGEQVPAAGGIPLGYGIPGLAARERRVVRVADVREHDNYVRQRYTDVETRSAMAVPLIHKSRLIGVIDMESLEPAAFTEEHEQILLALASHVATAVENARLFERMVEEERRLEKDLVLAGEIQKGLLPRRGPRFEALDTGAAYLPARTLGGDFYDFIACTDGRLAVVAGDVAGKGMPAALYGSLAVGLIRGQLLERPAGPAEILRQLNDRLMLAGCENRYVTLLFSTFDPESGTLTMANAGFSRPVLYRRGEVQRVAVEGTPLGMLPDRRYRETRLVLKPRDVLAFCSDGLEDAVDGQDEHFGETGLREVLQHIGGASAQQIADGILRANTAYAGEYEEHPDDRTVVVIKMG